jgi:hypothetical protein
MGDSKKDSFGGHFHNRADRFGFGKLWVHPMKPKAVNGLSDAARKYGDDRALRPSALIRVDPR